ncbi:cytochrome P450 [Nitrosomonas oligotropha]|uniref:cytochrome P450 n=1 Tax=Nitrosomonas oligotropha TaxID=42354 RepID=UPI001367C320|nr:cytochrome P450 [Nitrosomonas oligotropha]MXS83536.1 cytochrome P450 [Nitrosomonas oligotropha]
MSTSYLERYDAAPDAEKFPLVRRWMDKEPLPFFKELRAKRPILVTPDCTLVTRFDDVREILLMYKVFTVKPYVPKMDNYLMAHDDDALHTREKSLMQFMLNRDDLPRVRNLVADIASGILGNANGQIEVVNKFCRMVPATLVQKYFGLTGANREDLIEWSYWNQYDTFHNQPFDLLPPELSQRIIDRHSETSKKLGDYITMLIAKRLLAVKLEKLTFSTIVRLDDDIVTRMLRTSFAKELDFDIKRLGVNAGGLLIGAIETTAQAVAQVLQYLFQHSQWLAAAKAAAQKEDTTEFDGIVWEALRFAPITSYLFRTTVSDYTAAKGTDHETVLCAGTYVLPVTLSATFDERAFESPDEFIPQRNWYNYFHFGFGNHECLGRYVGMVMIPEMVRQVLLQKDIAPKSDIDYKSGPFPEAYDLSWATA